MSEAPQHGNAQSSHGGMIAIIAVIVGLMVIGGFAFLGGGPTVTSTPVPKGEVEIYIEFKGVSTGDYNELYQFAGKLAEPHCAIIKGSGGVPDRGESQGQHGFWNDGFVRHRYTPNHPVPSRDVEREMQNRLQRFLRDKGIDAKDVTLDLRYGP